MCATVVAYVYTRSHGALDPEPLMKKRRQTNKKNDSSEGTVSKPKQLTEFEGEEEESTTKDVAHIFRHLKRMCAEGDRRVHYYSFLVNPESFARTVENMFHFSFLVKVRRNTCIYGLFSGVLCVCVNHFCRMVGLGFTLMTMNANLTFTFVRY